MYIILRELKVTSILAFNIGSYFTFIRLELDKKTDQIAPWLY